MPLESDTYVLRIDAAKTGGSEGLVEVNSAESIQNRYTLRHVHTGARRSFASLSALVAFLTQVSDPARQPRSIDSATESTDSQPT